MFSGDMEGARTSVFYADCIWQRDTRKGDQEEASWTSPGAPSMARDASTRLCCHSEHVGDSGAHVSALCMLGKHCQCQKPRPDGSQSKHRTLEELWSPRATPGAVGRGPPARRTAHASVGCAGGRPRSLAPAWSPWQRARGGRGRAAAAAISAASCSLRPRRHGNGVTQLGRLSARLARVTPAARAPSSPSRTLPGARGRQGGRLMGDAY